MQARQQGKQRSRLFLLFAYILLAWAVPLIISLGRLLTSAGSSAFVFPKFVDFVSDWNQHGNTTMPHPAANSTVTHPGCRDQGGNQDCMSGGALSGAAVAIGCNIIVNLCTRIPAIFSEFRDQYRKLKPKTDEQSTVDSTSPTESVPYFDFRGMRYSSGLIYAGLKSVNFTSGSFVALSSYLSIKSLDVAIEQCLFHLNIADENPQARLYTLEVVALLFAATSFANYFIYNVRKGDKNAKMMASNLVQGNFPPIDRTLAATLLAASPASIVVGPMAFFTTFHALDKICWLPMSTDVRYAFAGVSFLTATTARILTDVPAMYRLMNGYFKPTELTTTEYSSCMTRPYKLVVYSAGLGDSAGTSVSNFTGFISTVSMVTNIPQHHPALVTTAAACALSAGALNFAFGVHTGVKDGMHLFFTPKKETRYQLLSGDDSVADVEAALPAQPAVVVAAIEQNRDSDLPTDALDSETKQAISSPIAIQDLTNECTGFAPRASSLK